MTQYNSLKQAAKNTQRKSLSNSEVFTTITNYAAPLKAALLAYQKSEDALVRALDALAEAENSEERIDGPESVIMLHANLARHKVNCINRLRQCRADVTETTAAFQALWAKNCAEEDALKNLFGGK